MSDAVRAAGVVTLTTDFGHKGPYVATMKGAILRRYPDATIVDLTHETSVYFPAEAGFWLSRAFRYFPDGTVHVAVVDPGVGTERDILVATAERHIFVAPDNGLLAPVLAGRASARIFRVSSRCFDAIGVATRRISRTFHGRDILAPIAAELAMDRLRAEDVGPPVESIVPSWVDDPQVLEGRVSGVVIAVDHFGNLISNIDEGLVAGMKQPRVRAGGHELGMRATYGDVQPGEYLALVNSFGVVEIARAEQSAAEGLGLERGAPIVVHDAG